MSARLRSKVWENLGGTFGPLPTKLRLPTNLPLNNEVAAGRSKITGQSFLNSSIHGSHLHTLPIHHKLFYLQIEVMPSQQKLGII